MSYSNMHMSYNNMHMSYGNMHMSYSNMHMSYSNRIFTVLIVFLSYLLRITYYYRIL